MMSTRTVIRDRILSEFQTLSKSGAGRVPAFETSPRWLSVDETKRASTYCVVVTDETPRKQTHQHDLYELTGVVVIYANDTKDARAKLDLMIEDAIEVLRRAFEALRQGYILSASIDTVTTTEASTAEDDWPQAVIRWTATHHRPGMV